MSDLSARSRELLRGRELEGLSYRELADSMELPLGTVMSGLSRARRAMKSALMKRMRRERQGFTLQATALVHEAYLRLAGTDFVFKDQHHFVGIAARSMRQILVDRARARHAQKRWAQLDRVSLTESLVHAVEEDAMLPALDEALDRLEQLDPEQARIIELRYFVGLSVEEAAAAMNISPATLKRRFMMARAWLFRELQGGTA